MDTTAAWPPRDARLDEGWLSKRFATKPKFAPRVLIAALTLTVAISFGFGFWWPQEPLQISTSGFIVTAGLFVGALAIERLTELLIAPWVGDVVGKASRTVLIGSIAAVLGAIVAGSMGLYLLEILTDEAIHTTPNGVTPTVDESLIRSIDILVTAMAIAGGTKPLHDLLSSLEKRTAKAKEGVSEEAADTANPEGVDPATAGPTTAPYRLVVTLAGESVSQERIESVISDITRILPGSTVTPNGTTLVVSGELPFGAGTKSYTKRVFESAYRLAAAGYPTEPDLAAPASLTIGTESTDPRPDAEDRDWAIKQMKVTVDDLKAAGEGEGITIGHPDTGYRLYPEKPNWDLTRDHDFVDDDADAADSLITQINVFEPDFVPSVGHGTSTASIIGGQRPDDDDDDDERRMYPMASKATIIPYRVMHGPVHLFDSDVAQAVRSAVDADCKVISMSLGGYGFSGLRTEIQHAVDKGVIVLAAAGNQVGITVSPADYPETIAVASSKANGFPYVEGSSQGPEVTITAPGTDVWRVGIKQEDGSSYVSQSTGTSYAVAHVAGLAAVWYGKHAATLETFVETDADGKEHRRKVSRTFAHLLKSTATTWEDEGFEHWEDYAQGFGPGIVNGKALLDAPITGEHGPTDDDLMRALPMDEPEQPGVKITAIAANLFTGEGTIDVKTKIVTKLVDFFGADRKSGEEAASADQAARDANVQSVVNREAEHHYRTDSEFRQTLDGKDEPGVPAAATREFSELVGAFNASTDGANRHGDMSKALRRALAGTTSVRGRYKWVGFALLGLAVLGSALLGWYWGVDDPVGITATTTVLFTAFYIAAQALERLVEYTFGRTIFYEKPDRLTERSLILLGITIALGCVLAGLTGFRLLEALAGPDAMEEDVSGFQRSVSIFVTGLAIGGGTKPLHDLLTRIQTRSKSA